MKKSLSSTASTSVARRPRRSLALGTAILCGLSLAAACSDDDDVDPVGNGGTAGRGGSAGAAGTAGAAGAAGAAGTAGAAGAAGAAGSGNNTPVDGTVTVLSTDDALLGPTTAAVRGTNLWIVNGQLGSLGGTPAPEVPFTLVSLPLAGGAIGATRIELPGNEFFPEGIAAADDGTLYVGSVRLGSIVRIGATATEPDEDEFVEAGVAERGVVGLTVDEDRDLLWFCDSSPEAQNGGDLVGVSLDDGTESVRHALPDRGATGGDGADAGADAGDAGSSAGQPTFCNDVVVADDGDIFATDSSGRIFRVPAAGAETANSAAVWLDAPAISPPAPGGFGVNGIAQVGDNLIVASGDALFVVDPEATNPGATLRELNVTLNGATVSFCGPDGLEAVPGSDDQVIVVENGFCTPSVPRVVSVTLDL